MSIQLTAFDIALPLLPCCCALPIEPSSIRQTTRPGPPPRTDVSCTFRLYRSASSSCHRPLFPPAKEVPNDPATLVSSRLVPPVVSPPRTPRQPCPNRRPSQRYPRHSANRHRTPTSPQLPVIHRSLHSPGPLFPPSPTVPRLRPPVSLVLPPRVDRVNGPTDIVPPHPPVPLCPPPFVVRHPPRPV